MKLEKLAGCLIIENGKVLMVKEKKDMYWKIPSGKVNCDETLENCAIRETEEETGKKIELVDKFGTYNFNFKERKFQLVIYEAIIVGEGNKNEKDNVNLNEWVPINEMAEGVNNIPSNKLIYNNLK